MSRCVSRLQCECLESRQLLAADLLTTFAENAPAPISQVQIAAMRATECPFAIQSPDRVEAAFQEDEPVSAALDVAGNFLLDDQLDVLDLNLLTAAIASGSNPLEYDLFADGVVDRRDLDTWLAVAGDHNLGDGRAYLMGDANLDGAVDGMDAIHLGWHMFTNDNQWSNGDFNADGVVDGSDMGVWNANKFRAS